MCHNIALLRFRLLYPDGEASLRSVYAFITMILRLYNKIHTSNQQRRRKG
ncbi:MAG: hypothetical protein V7K77_07000 [Nostoc sp.]